MDPLAQIIGLLRPHALLWKQRIATGEWAIRFPSHDGAVFSLVTQGQCVFQLPDRPATCLGAGDFILLIAPPVWILGSSKEVSPRDFDRAEAIRATAAARTAVAEIEGATRILGGYFAFDRGNLGLLKTLLPALVEVGPSHAGASRLRTLLDLIGDEASSPRPGSTLILQRLLDVMLVEAIRLASPTQHTSTPGLVAALSDPRIATALTAMHDDVGKPWTIAKLAAHTGMSRSVFAQRFERIVGLPAIEYLRQWRMALAREALREGRDSLSEIAFRYGYRSVSAFSAAFSRTVGCAPSRYAASAAGADRDGTRHGSVRPDLLTIDESAAG